MDMVQDSEACGQSEGWPRWHVHLVLGQQLLQHGLPAESSTIKHTKPKATAGTSSSKSRRRSTTALGRCWSTMAAITAGTACQAQLSKQTKVVPRLHLAVEDAAAISEVRGVHLSLQLLNALLSCETNKPFTLKSHFAQSDSAITGKITAMTDPN